MIQFDNFYENNENDEYDNKKINESKSGSLGHVEKKVRNYSSIKNNGIREIQKIIDAKNKKINLNYILINKNKTAYRTPPDNIDINDNNKCESIEHKRNERTRFNYIKRSLGIEQKEKEINKNDFDELKLNKHLLDLDDDNDYDDAVCIII